MLRSPPSRRRGLKSCFSISDILLLPSPPSRRRGLKLDEYNEYCHELLVASFAEAWIEILRTLFPYCSFLVASFAEAWIEI